MSGGTEDTPNPAEIPADETLEMTADYDHEKTPTGKTVGTCWRCWVIKPVTIVAPAPGSSHEAMRYQTCVEARNGRWAFCGVRMVLRLGEFEIYVGPERRVVTTLPPLVERRGVRVPPRDDGDQR